MFIRAPRREMAERPLKAIHLIDLGLGIDVDRAIEDHPANSLWEQFRIERADPGAVRRPEVIDLGITYQVAQQIKIAYGLDGRNVPAAPGSAQAGLAELDLCVDPGAQLAGIIG